MKGIIGTIHWDGCDDCKYYDEENGGCLQIDHSRSRWDDSLYVDLDMDDIVCTCFEEKKK